MGRFPGTLLALAAVTAGLAAAAADAGSSPGRIVFSADRAPSLNGEIYRLDRDGRRVDLSRSPAQDVDPVVSPNGKLVAFSSNRGGKVALYTVRIDGTGLRRVSSFFGSAVATLVGQSPLAWSPDGRRLLAVLPSGLWVSGRQIAHRVVAGAGWSPGGRELAWQDQNGGIHVVSPTGRRLWKTFGQGFAWSATGRLAVTESSSSIAVYDGHGRRLARFAGANLAWSPNGKALASLLGTNLRRLQIRSGGAGRPSVNTYVDATNGVLEWLGNQRLRIFTGDGWIGYDVAGRRPWTLPQGYGDGTYTFPGIGTKSGSAVVAPTVAGGEETLHVATPEGVGPGIETATICGDEAPFGSLQFTPGGRSLVYQSYCTGPSADLYSVAPDGTGLRRLIATPTDETDPAASASGAQIAYTERDQAECKGCTETIWEMHADGSGRHALTTQTNQNTIWTDSAPSYSPDGASIVFSHWAGNAVRLDVIPARGGKSRQLRETGSYPAWGPRRIAFLASRNSRIETVLPDGSKPQLVASAPQLVGGGLAWSRDGRLAWLEQRKGGRLALAVARGKHVARFPLGSLRPQYDGAGVAWSPDGSRLALTGCDGTGICDVWSVSPNGTGLRRVTHDLGAGTHLSWVGG